MSDTTPIVISRAAPSEQAAALHQVLASVPEPLRDEQVAAIIAGEAGQPEALAGLLVARRGAQTVGAIWAQPLAGSGASVWPPRTIDNEPRETLVALLNAAIEFLTAAPINMAQVLLPAADRALADVLTAAHFELVADLIYLVALPSAAPADEIGTLEYLSVAAASYERLTATLARTYEQSLDCPGLNGRRAPQEVLDEYRHIGQYDPARWLLVQHQANDIGCLILNTHDQGATWELVYMGLVPEARGHGWGRLVVQHAQQLAAAAGAEKLLLAVDRANVPAVNMYESCGFVGWDERAAYVRFLR